MKERRYGRWVGNRKGVSEDKELCVESVYNDYDRFSRSSQCSRKRGYGPNNLYCKQHARMIAEEKGLL